MSAYDSPMTVGKMPNGQLCIRLPRGLVATMEAGSDVTREADAAEVARRWNTHPDLLAALHKALEWVERVESVAWDSIPEGMRGDNGAAWAIRSAIARATGGGK